MKVKSILFPSVVESNSVELNGVADNLETGLRLFEDNTSYIIGELALSEGFIPLRSINGIPSNIDYKLLFKSGLLLAGVQGYPNTPKVIVTGFPFALYQVNREETIHLYKGIHNISYDPTTFGNAPLNKPYKIVVHDIVVIPEIMACVIGAREFESNMKGRFFMISLGFGSFDACLSNDRGIIQRTVISTHGLRYAINLFAKELSKKFYLDLRSEHQLDRAFIEGNIILNRKRYNISDLRKTVLERYYKDIISPSLNNYWKDDDFVNTNYIVLSGGGALYDDLVKCFEEEFKELIAIKVVNEPLILASKGYFKYAINNLGVEAKYAVGLDVGNSNTVVTFEEMEQQIELGEGVLDNETEKERHNGFYKSRIKFDDTMNSI